MATALTIIGIIIGLILLYPILGALLPMSVTGKALLKRELKQRGIDWHTLPQECLNDLVNRAIDIAKFLKLGSPRESTHTHLIQHIQYQASAIQRILQDNSREDTVVVEVLEKYGVINGRS